METDRQVAISRGTAHGRSVSMSDCLSWCRAAPGRIIAGGFKHAAREPHETRQFILCGPQSDLVIIMLRGPAPS